MKNTNMIALAMIVEGVEKEARPLIRCLQNVLPHVDKAFITVTHKKGEEPDKNVLEVLSLFKNIEVSHFEWVFDFSKARNFNFSQVPKEYEYILWCDADDVFHNLDKLVKIVKENKADAYTVQYAYHYDEDRMPDVVHLKTQIVKNDGCVEWAGSLHEDFKENRMLDIRLVNGVERRHMSKDDRFEQAAQRNYDISIKNISEDPRSFWNAGNSAKAVGKNEEALGYFEKFLTTSKSDEEKYLVNLRTSECHVLLGNMDSAITAVRNAIGLRPEYPDAYHLLGNIYYSQGKYEEARDMFISGLTKKPPVHSIIAYNPRDYDYNPLMGLAKAYFAVGMPQLAVIPLEGCLKIYPHNERIKKMVRTIRKEAKKADKVVELVSKLRKIRSKKELKKELDALPVDFRSHPQVCHLRNTNFIKKKSSGKDIAFFCGFTEREWTPKSVSEGIGGSEEAIIWLSRLLAKKGWNVEVFNNCGHKEQVFDGVKYKPFWSWNTRDKYDAVILWRSLKMLDYEINCDNVFVDLHDVIPAGELNEQRVKKVKKIFVKSDFHRSLFPHVPDDKFIIVPNGIDFGLFEGEHEKDKYLMINTSSPDRGLRGLVEMYGEVKKKVPNAKLAWAYGWDVWDIVHKGDEEKMKWKADTIELMRKEGVIDLGRIGHDKVAELYKKAAVFAYPTEFAEIDCISMTKAMAAGAIPVCTDFAALGSKKGVFVHSELTKDNWCPAGRFDFSLTERRDEWIEKVVKTLNEGYTVDDMRSSAKCYDWSVIVDIWDTWLASSLQA